ncbi:murein hydrolase activator EnvC [Rhizobium sp. LjRoot30]|uniref:murein hydrolase activator EnvC family protein n=1 Tax=Rhizobium sp. LjRoot30 TaxID=3342320 RepID=UPI003ECFA50E
MDASTCKPKRALLAGLSLAVVAGLSQPPFLPEAFAQEKSGTQPRIVAESDPTAELQRERDLTRSELETLSRTMTLSAEKAASLKQSIDALEKSTVSLRSALIDSANRRKQLDKQIAASGEKLAELNIRRDKIHGSLKERRGLLAEVLAALQRMGRNPPPALLVTPDDALASVRSAILLGAVVPGIRKETERLATDLQELATLSAEILTEKANFTTTVTNNLEEERRMDLLIVENDKLSRKTAEELEAERRHAKDLAARATSLEGLIGSLETEITSVREAAALAKAEEEKRRQMTDEQRQKAKELAENGVPDKNRIAPAYAFSDLKNKLELPVAGEIIRQFGDADGTGHPAKGMTIASTPGMLVTAPADGSVVFAGVFRSYGQVVILNTGDGYHLVMSGMDQIKTRQGKFVFAGEPLAVMGEKRVASATALALETDRPTLYIEFRKGDQPVDSRPWWTATGTGKARNDT